MRLVKELISPHLNGLFVTPKDIDETMQNTHQSCISEALNLLFSKGHAHIKENKRHIVLRHTKYMMLPALCSGQRFFFKRSG